VSKAVEDAKWVDEGSTAAEKRRAEKETKRLEAAQKEAKRKALVAKDDEEAAAAKKRSAAADRVTRQAILSVQERQAADAEKQAARERELRQMKQANLIPQIEPIENVNQSRAAQEAQDRARYGANGVVSASTLDEAVAAAQKLSGKQTSKTDKHPEKRMRAAFADYLERMMPACKAEHPTLKHSQLHEIIWKSWQKAPENPHVAAAIDEASKAGT